MNSSLTVDIDTQQLKPDLNSLTVFCDEKEVGIVRFDLSKYYGKKQDLLRANISARKDHDLDDISVAALESD